MSAVAALEDNRVVISHQPLASADPAVNRARNLRIFDSMALDEMSTSMLYHFHIELAAAGNHLRSREIGFKVLARPDLRAEDRAAICANLGIQEQAVRPVLHDADTAKLDRLDYYSSRCRAFGLFGKHSTTDMPRRSSAKAGEH